MPLSTPISPSTLSTHHHSTTHTDRFAPMVTVERPTHHLMASVLGAADANPSLKKAKVVCLAIDFMNPTEVPQECAVRHSTRRVRTKSAHIPPERSSWPQVSRSLLSQASSFHHQELLASAPEVGTCDAARRRFSPTRPRKALASLSVLSSKLENPATASGPSIVEPASDHVFHDHMST